MAPYNKHRCITLFAFFLSGIPFCYSQQPIQTEQEASFFEIQKEFYDYWEPFNVKGGYYTEDGVEKKAYGWKQFKRWEWYWQQRIDPQTGAFPEKTAADIRRKIRTTGFTKDDASNWTSVGPDFSLGGYAGVGRINCIGFRPGDNNTYYVGSPSGGFWKTTDDAATWTPLTDDNDVIGVSDVVVIAGATTATDVLYIATGDRDVGPMSNLPSNHLADNHSIGVLKSTDGGSTWSATGLSFSAGDRILTNRILLHPDNNDILYAATSDGLYKTSNAGDDWTKISTEDFVDLEFKPGLPSTIYASTRSGGEVWVSVDNGSSWGEQLNVYGGYRTEIAVSPDEPDRLYAVVVDGDRGLEAVYRSVNNGATFTEVYEHPVVGNGNHNILHRDCSPGAIIGGQGHYDIAIAADPNDGSTLYIGGINTWKSTDGGSSFSIVNHWTETCGGVCEVVHADKHCLAFQNGTSVLFEGNDGGIYRTLNGGVNWTDLSDGLVISQYYRISVSQQATNQIIGGLQDNGTKSMIDGTWTDVRGGDGMDCAINPENHNIQYSTNQYSSLYKTTNHWATNSYISGGLGQGNWISPFLIDPNNSSTLYFACSQVFKSTSAGGSWSSISSGIPKDAWAMDVAPSNSDYIYVAVEDALYKTTTGDAPWTDITGTLPVSTSFLTAVTVSFEDPETVWVCMGGYDTDCIYETTDGGTTWTNISSGLPQVPALDIIQNDYNDAQKELYAATDVGVYQKIGSADWTPYMTNLPNVVVNDLEIYYDSDDPDDSQIFAGTYGRGVWQSDLPAEQICWPPSNLTISNLDCFSVDISWTAGDASLWNIQYGLGGFELGSGTIVEGVDTNPYSLVALDASTEYDFYVQGDCEDATGTSTWIGPLTFTTEPHGTTCDCAHLISAIPFNQTGMTTENAGNNYNLASGSEPCGTGFMDAEEYVFSYTPASDIYIDVTLTNTENNTSVFIYDGCPGNPATSCVASDYSFGSNPSVSSVLLRSKTEYHIVVSSASATPYTGFDINISEGSQPVMSFPYSENFENGGALPDDWFTEQISGTTTWAFQDGGHAGNPSSAQEGSYNAFLFDEDTDDDKARLISPLINLSAASVPELAFYSTQAAWTGQDELKVYYRTTSDGAWSPLPSAEWTAEISSWTEHVIELPSPSATYQIALEGNAKYGYGVCIDNFSIREQPVNSWSGMMNSEWNEMMNWDMGVPGDADNLLIPNYVMNMPEINDFRQCNNLTIQDGANLTIQPSGSFTVNGNLIIEGANGIIIESDATGTGSLIVDGDISGGGTAQIERHIPAYTAAAGWHFLSAPVASQAICNEFVDNSDPGNPIPGADDFFKWDEPNNIWKNTKDDLGSWNDAFEDDFLVGRGYLVGYQSDQTKTYTGIPNNSALTLNALSAPPITYTPGQGNGWNLIGNPFPSGMDADEFVSSNLDASVYAFDGNTGQYLSWNGMIGTLSEGVVPPMNGFFIKASSDDPALTIPLSSRVHTSTLFLKKKQQIDNVLKLTVESSEGHQDHTFISYLENASHQFDSQYDAYKLFGSESVPHLYTLANDLSLSINTLPYESENIIDLQFSSGQAGSYKLFWESSFDRKYKLTLKDRMTDNYIDMQKEQEYTFDYQPQQTENLFQVHIKGITGLSEFERTEELLVYYERSGIVVEIPEKHKEVFIQLFNSLGQRLYQGYLHGSGKHHISAPSVRGMIIVHAQTTTVNYTNKILLQK